MFNLEVDEFITEVFGSAGGVIDSIGFKTNKGREFKAGGKGGKPFTMTNHPNYGVAYFEGGKNGDIHNLTMFSGAIPLVMTTTKK